MIVTTTNCVTLGFIGTAMVNNQLYFKKLVSEREASKTVTTKRDIGIE